MADDDLFLWALPLALERLERALDRANSEEMFAYADALRLYADRLKERKKP